jgi:allantoicase
MIIYKCDKCNNEILQTEKVSKYTHLEIKYLPDGKISNLPQEDLFCEKCSVKIQEAIEKIK